jgi:tape measure domain-containing protein
MAEEISVPIRLPTDSSSVSAAKVVVAGLAAGMKALGPAAAAGSSQAQAEMRALGAAATAAQKEVTRAQGQQAARSTFKGPAASKDEAKARAAAERAAGAVAVKHAKDTADIQRAFMKEAANKRAADMKEAQGLATGALGVLATITAAAAAVSAQFVKAIVSVQAFRESTLGAYAKLLGGASAADKAFKETIKTADQIGMSYEDALRGVNSLIAKGFKADQAQDLVKAMADLKSVVPDANIGNLLLAITQIKSKGVLQMEELQGQIAEAGLSVSVVLEEIGKGIGKSGAEVRKMISQGKISADQGVAGIMAAIQKTTGKPIGKAAEEASKSLGGLLARLEQIPGGLLLMADASKGVGDLKDVLGNILKAFAPSTESGKALSASLGRLGDAFAVVLGGLKGEGGAKLMQDFAASMALSADRAADLVTKLGLIAGPALTEFLKGFNSANKLLGGKEAQSGTAGYEALGAALGKVGRALGFIAGLVGTVDVLFGAAGQMFELAGALGDLGSSLSGVWTTIQGWIATAAAAVGAVSQAIGTNLVNGIIAGISLASPMLAAAIQGLAAMSTGTMQTATQIHSPSKVWRDDIGYQLPAGAAEGVYDGAPLMATAARDVAGMTTRSGASAASSAGGAMVGGGGGRTYNFAAGSVVIQVQGGNARSIAADLMTELEAIV